MVVGWNPGAARRPPPSTDSGDPRMTSGCFLPRTPARAGVVLAGAGLLILLPGCGDAARYPDALEYPVRTDWHVNANPKNKPPASDFPAPLPPDGLDALARQPASDR